MFNSASSKYINLSSLFKAAQFGRKVAVLDYVDPSPQGKEEKYQSNNWKYSIVQLLR